MAGVTEVELYVYDEESDTLFGKKAVESSTGQGATKVVSVEIQQDVYPGEGLVGRSYSEQRSFSGRGPTGDIEHSIPLVSESGSVPGVIRLFCGQGSLIPNVDSTSGIVSFAKLGQAPIFFNSFLGSVVPFCDSFPCHSCFSALASKHFGLERRTSHVSVEDGQSGRAGAQRTRRRDRCPDLRSHRSGT